MASLSDPFGRLLKAARFARSLSGGIKLGEFFPHGGNHTPATAPQGTSASPPRGGLWKRLRHEHEWFTHTHHQLSVPHLDRPIEILFSMV